MFALPYVQHHLQRFNQEEHLRVQRQRASLLRTVRRVESSSRQRERQLTESSSSSHNFKVTVGQTGQLDDSEDEALTPKQRVAKRKEMELRRRHLELKVKAMGVHVVGKGLVYMYNVRVDAGDGCGYI